MDNRQGDQSDANLHEELKTLQNTASMLKEALSAVNNSLIDFSKDLDNKLTQSAKSVDDEMRQLRDAVQSLRIDCNEFQRTGTQIADAIKWSMLERTKQSLALTNSFERMTDRLGVIESMFRLMPATMPMLTAAGHHPVAYGYNQQQGFPAAGMIPFTTDIRACPQYQIGNVQNTMQNSQRMPLNMQNNYAPPNKNPVPLILPPSFRRDSTSSSPRAQENLHNPASMFAHQQRNSPAIHGVAPVPRHPFSSMMPSHQMAVSTCPFNTVVRKEVTSMSKPIVSEVSVSHLSLLDGSTSEDLLARLTIYPGENRLTVVTNDKEDVLIDCPLDILFVNMKEASNQIGIHDGNRIFNIVIKSCPAISDLFGLLKPLCHESSWLSSCSKQAIGNQIPVMTGDSFGYRQTTQDYASTESSGNSDDGGGETSSTSDDFEEPEILRRQPKSTGFSSSPKEVKQQSPLFGSVSSSMPIEPLFGNLKLNFPSTSFPSAETSPRMAAPLKQSFTFTASPSTPLFKPSHSPERKSIKPSGDKSVLSFGTAKHEGGGGGLTERFGAKANLLRGNGQWSDCGPGVLKIFEDELGRRRVMFEKEGTENVGCNHFITTQTKLVRDSDGSSFVWNAVDFSKDEKGSHDKFKASFENKSDSDKFYAVFNRTDRADPNRTKPELLKKEEKSANTSADSLSNSKPSAAPLFFSPGKSPSTAMDDKSKPLFASFSFEKSPPANPPFEQQKSSENVPLFGAQPPKSDGKLLFGGKFPTGSCSLTQIVERSGKAGSLFGSNTDSKKVVFGTAVKPLFGQPAADKTVEKSTEDDSGAEKKAEQGESEPQFEPVITMPTSVQLVTGEEGLTEHFCARAVLYRFQKEESGGQWKERGRGLMKILEEPNGKRRVLLRRDHVYKLACNHLISASTKLMPHHQKENCFCWFAMDYSESEKGVIEQFCVRFKAAADAEKFSKEFEAGVKAAGLSEPKVEKPNDEPQKEKSQEPQVVEKSGLKLVGAHEGDWSCQQCLSNNPSDCNSCKACSHPRDSNANNVSTDGNKNTSLFSLPSTSKPSAAPLFFSPGKSPSTAMDDKSKPLFASFSFEKSPSANPPSEQQKSSENVPLFGAQPPKSDGKLLFGGKFPTGSCSLTQIVERSGKAGSLFGSNTDSKKVVFGTAVKPLFGQPAADKTVEKSTEDDSGAEKKAEQGESEPQFEPVITMPTSVQLVTGEEGLTEHFCARAVLYRFQKEESGGQWKERGRGLMKILEEPNGKRRVLLRRDHVYKLACNHLISASTKLMPHHQKENCFCWFAMDYSESEKGVIEKFCVRFENSENAKKFSTEFEIGVKCASGSSSTKSSSNEKPAPENNQDNSGNAPLKLVNSRDGDWNCQHCLVANHAEATKCGACGENRASD